MKINYTYKGTTPTKGLEDACEERLSKLNRFFHSESEADVTFRVEGKTHTMSVYLKNNGRSFSAKASTALMYDSIKECEEILKNQIVSHKRGYRTDSHKRHNSIVFSEAHNMESDEVTEETKKYHREIDASIDQLDKKEMLTKKYGTDELSPR
ncbi:MAG: HPF/RaiA family ribosome-associated protein [Spirochaetales bacterium]